LPRSACLHLRPTPGGDVLKAEIHGDLATILVFYGNGKKRLPNAGAPESQLSAVAGARYRLYRNNRILSQPR
jgi:hypothetical protein